LTLELLAFLRPSVTMAAATMKDKPRRQTAALPPFPELLALVPPSITCLGDY
jgi:hypothetical protein